MSVHNSPSLKHIFRKNINLNLSLPFTAMLTILKRAQYADWFKSGDPCKT